MSRFFFLFVLAQGCSRDTQQVGEFDVSWQDDAGTVQVDWHGRRLLDGRQWSVGTGDADVEFSVGSYLFSEETQRLTHAEGVDVTSSRRSSSLTLTMTDADGDPVALLQAWAISDDVLRLQLASLDGGDNRSRARFACTGDDVFLGGGAHAFDVDHQGEAFALWTSEPGLGKSDDEETPAAWYLTGTRHASSYPVPFLLRPSEPMGLAVDTFSRVELDLCTEDTWSTTAWEGSLNLLVVAGNHPLEIVETHTLASGAPVVPPDWAFAPWNDAVKGADRVREVAATLRAAGAPSSVIWTEDWKGASEGPLGYKLDESWELDRGLYPDAEALDAELEALGFKWLSYFSPFLPLDSEEAEKYAIRAPDGQSPYWFTGVGLEDVTVIDVTNPDAAEWAIARMQDNLDIGFDGWMADYAEWLPPDAVLHGMDAMDDHNAQPVGWQMLSADAQDGYDATFFARSGWTGSQSISPITWAGDQRTSFDIDDGLPTVVPLALGLAVGGVAFFGHDIAGYQSTGNPPSDRELWYRWAALGAFSPIMRTHHGRYSDDNWQFDTDAETLAHYARYGGEHVRLFPYLRGLAEQARTTGRPLLLPPALVYVGDDWGRTDAWLLGQGMLVAPVMEAGVSGRDVQLPDEVDWYDWWTGAPAESGWVDADIDEIPVFVAAGHIVPVLTDTPDTLAPASDRRVFGLDRADSARTVRVFGAGGAFTEADGTRYEATGSANGSDQTTVTLGSGSVELAGVTVTIAGAVERAYTIEVWGD